MDFRSFDSESVVTLWLQPNASALNMPSQRGVLRYQSMPTGPGGKESLALLGAKNAAALRDTMRESITETVRMVMLDIDVDPTTAAQPKDLKSFAFNVGNSISEIKGQGLKTSGGRAILLGTSEALFAARSWPAPPRRPKSDQGYKNDQDQRELIASFTALLLFNAAAAATDFAAARVSGADVRRAIAHRHAANVRSTVGT